jgi:hypothetical protein
MECLVFDGQGVIGALALFVFPSSDGHEQQAHTIDTSNAPQFKIVKCPKRNLEFRMPKPDLYVTLCEPGKANDTTTRNACAPYATLLGYSSARRKQDCAAGVGTRNNDLNQQRVLFAQSLMCGSTPPRTVAKKWSPSLREVLKTNMALNGDVRAAALLDKGAVGVSILGPRAEQNVIDARGRYFIRQG